MRSPNQFIVKPEGGKRYSNTEEIGGVEVVISASEEDHKFSNRRAVVVALPLDYTGPIKEGHTLLVHHNVFKFYNDMGGRRKSGKSFFRDDRFFIDYEQFFMWHDGQEWHAYDRYCFIEPIPPEDSVIFKPLSREPLMGIMRYPNDYLTSQGVNPGDKVSFAPESEYEFNVDGVPMYRVFDHQVAMTL